MELENRADRSRSGRSMALPLWAALAALILSASDPFPSQAAPNALIGGDRFLAAASSYQPAAASPSFGDVPVTHPHYDDIELLYQAGYTAGCSTDPLLYCPEQAMNRAESAVFVERGIHSASYSPPTPTSQVFADLPLDSWAASWVNGLWADSYTAGCGTNPLVYCPWQGHTRAEGCVFYLRMLNGADFVPPEPGQQTFADVPLDAWYAKWVEAAYSAHLIPACQESPGLRFCPDDPLTRAMAAHMMVQAKGLLPQSPEWTQFGHDAQHTNYTPVSPPTEMEFAWHLQTSMPDLTQPVTGNGKIFIISGDTVYALDKNTGSTVWSKPGLGTLRATPVYDPAANKLYVVSDNSPDGSVWRLDATNGSYHATNDRLVVPGAPLRLSPAYAANTLIVASTNARIYAVNVSTTPMTHRWAAPYDARAQLNDWSTVAIAAHPAYSVAHQTVIVEVEDRYASYLTSFPSARNHLTVHAIDATTGAQKWIWDYTADSGRYYEDGSNRAYAECAGEVQGGGLCLTRNGSQFSRTWPVIADRNGLVLVRVLLDWNAMWAGPYNASQLGGRGGAGIFPPSNSEIRSFLANHHEQALFALKLDTTNAGGEMAFTPAVGSATANDGSTARVGSVPIVKVVDNQEVAYTYVRSGKVCEFHWSVDPVNSWCDGRGDSVLGELVLNSGDGIKGCDTSGGPCSAGDFRLVRSSPWLSSASITPFMPGDEIEDITLAGNVFYHNHWMVTESWEIGDRSQGDVGNSYLNPIPATVRPYFAWRIQGPCTFSNTHYCAGGLVPAGDTRSFPPGFYFYHSGSSYTPPSIGSSVSGDGYVIVSPDLVIVKRQYNSDIMVLRPRTAAAISQSPEPGVSGASSSPPPRPAGPITPAEALIYLNQQVTLVPLPVDHVNNRLPKAFHLYVGDGSSLLQLRIMAQDMTRFDFDPATLAGRTVIVTGEVTLYPTDTVIPEILLRSPSQIQVVP